MPVKLLCPMGLSCTYKTEEVEEALALLDKHERMAHPVVNWTPTNGGKKPEKFPRPSIDLYSTAETWQEFHNSWLQYQDEYQLAPDSSMPAALRNLLQVF